MAKRNHQFQTIRTEGAILPPDILRRIASLKVDGVTPEAYHLPPGTKLNEAISQSWTALLKHWQAFQETRTTLGENGETGTAVTNERWLLPLFNELGYGRLVTSKSPVIGEKSYPVERYYNHTPIHLIGCRLSLDRRTKGARGAATASPHSMVQELLNCSDEHLWAFLSNGLQLRILRDNISLSRQTFVEFDLEALMEGEVYADFALLWLLCHQSRVESEKAEGSWLEKWSHLAREQGTRVLKDLRVGVARAIEALGRGFIGHPRNDRLREKLHSASLSKEDFYRQLLRIVYRLLFLFVAEDRELLHSPDASNDACLLYNEHYSTQRLRELALKMRGTKHADLWHSLSLVFDALGKNEGCPQLGLAGLGSFLWKSSSTPDLLGPHQANGDAVFITNDDLLDAIRALAYVEQDRVLRMVDYRNLGSEELGSVYESLLELHPSMDVEGKSFELLTAAGNERKTTGSYYTPDSLVQCLLDSALDPVVEDRLKGKRGEEGEKALLAIKVCDPASGSGHFLIAAAHRLARQLARIRTGESEPSPEDYQHALRDVIGRCLYGVDINPMAVELCKVSLWMEAIEPGKPLSFLDHHIQCGNSLLGATPTQLAKGIPDDAFKSIEGDDKSVCSDLKKANKRERQDYERGQGYLFSPPLKLGNLPATLARLNRLDDGTISDIAAKEAMYSELVKGADYRSARLLADTWCAAFVWKKDNTELGRLCPTERNFRSIEENPHSINIQLKSNVERLAAEYQLFHWHLSFPDVFRIQGDNLTAESGDSGWNGGFDVVLGNPPWERIKVQEREYFLEREPAIAAARTAAARQSMIEDLQTSNKRVYEEFKAAKRNAEAVAAMIRESNRFPLGGRGDLNTYPVFAELARSLIDQTGRVGCVLPSGIATDDTYKHFFRDLMEKKAIVRLLSFWEIRRFFPDTDSRDPFCLLTLTGTDFPAETALFAFDIRSMGEISQPGRLFSLSSADIELLNPNTRTCPVFANESNAQIAKRVYRQHPIILKEGEDTRNPWTTRFATIFHSGNDSNHFLGAKHLMDQGAVLNGNEFFMEASRFLPLYEQNMIHMHDHRFATYQDESGAAADTPRRVTGLEHSHAAFKAVPNSWVDETVVAEKYGTKALAKNWLIAFRKSARIGDIRTGIFCALPYSAISDSIHLISNEAEDRSLAPLLLSQLASFSFDFVFRQSLGGANASFYILKQLPVIPPERFEMPAGFAGDLSLRSWVMPRILELTFTSWDLEAFAQDCDYAGPPFRWDEERRLMLRSELDAAYFHLFLGEWKTGTNQEADVIVEPMGHFQTARAAVQHILDTFHTVRDNEVVAYGEYRTRRVVLEIYDEMAEAIRTGQPYQTRLNPHPGPPMDAAGNFIPMAQWDVNNWPSHIHPPREAVESVDWSLAAKAADDELMADVSYPATENDRLVCAAALSVIEQAGSISSMDHLDVLNLVTHPSWCKAFLGEPSQGGVDLAMAAVSELITTPGQPINWKQCRDFLELRKAISVDHAVTSQPISAASDIAAVKQSLPVGVDEAVRLALKALQAIEEVRKDLTSADSTQRQVIDFFDRQHRDLQLVA